MPSLRAPTNTPAHSPARSGWPDCSPGQFSFSTRVIAPPHFASVRPFAPQVFDWGAPHQSRPRFTWSFLRSRCRQEADRHRSPSRAAVPLRKNTAPQIRLRRLSCSSNFLRFAQKRTSSLQNHDRRSLRTLPSSLLFSPAKRLPRSLARNASPDGYHRRGRVRAPILLVSSAARVFIHSSLPTGRDVAGNPSGRAGVALHDFPTLTGGTVIPCHVT